MEEKVLKTIRKFSLISPNDTVIVGVSGGPDSVCLLHVLVSLKETLKIKEIVPAHLNHMLRGEESERDEAFVKELCKEWGLKLEVERVNVKEIPGNVEAVAREERYKFLNKVAEKYGANAIAVGHTASDLAETIILNLVKGTGIKGLRGFLPKRDKIVRPLYEVTRSEVESYLKERNIPFVVDSSNLDENFHRNLIRLKVVPLLRKINKNLEASFLRLSSILRNLESWIDEEVKKLLNKSITQNSVCFNRTEILKLPEILRSELFITAYKTLTGETLSFKNLVQIESVLKSSEYKEIDLGNGVKFLKSMDKVCLRKGQNEKHFFFVVDKLPSEVKTPFGTVRFLKNAGKPVLSYEDFQKSPIIVRKRREGDVVEFPYGKKKLKKLLVEKRIPAFERDVLPVVEWNGRILWIPEVYEKEVKDKDFVGVSFEPESSD